MVFEIIYEDGQARVGRLKTAHGTITTPFFMPVASKGSVKAISGPKLESIGFESIITNSFLLSLVPGIEVIEEHGGIHKFMNFKKTIFTDSGGFQVLSKDFLIKKSDEGAVFKDKSGQKMLYTPEKAIENQLKINSDIAMTLDDVAHYGLSGKQYVDAIRRTHNWAKRALKHHQKLKEELNSKQLLFGIAQGGTYKDYRRFSTFKINQMDFDGFALGGLVIGESRKELFETINESIKHFKKEKVRYLMGLGSPPDIIKAVKLGVDCFDSIYPTANARHGSLLTSKGRIMIKKVKYKHDLRPIEEGCQCSTCKNYSRAYIHHLLRTHELLGYELATIHNLHFMNNLIKEIRQAIKEKRYDEFSEDFLKKYFSGNEKKEFSNNIQQKYLEKEKRKKATILLDWKQNKN